MLDIQAIKTNKGYYISKGIVHQSWIDYSLREFLFDGEKPKPSFDRNWDLIKDKPIKVSRMVHQPNINYRFILTDDSIASDKIPLEIKQEDVGDTKDCEGQVIWKPELAMYRSLYELVSDEQPDLEVIEEFTFTILFEIGEILPPPYFVYPTMKFGIFGGKIETPSITNHDIQHQELDRIIFPSLLVHETPCKLSSEDTYKIVREYINTHINSAVAVVTSNYDFCFEVAKRIPLAKPYNQTYKYEGRSRRSRPRVETRLIKDRQVKFFEMTHEKAHYSGYTPIQGFEGKNEADLKEQIDSYLGELITAINEPATECPSCNGQGVIISEIPIKRDS